MVVRRETPADIDAIRALPGAAPALMDRLREGDAWLPSLSFVALGPRGEVVGHIAGNRGSVGATPALALAPPTVHLDHRGRGVGQALMHAVLGAADAVGEPLVAVVGNPPEYFTRFGFRPSRELDITAPLVGWEPYFRIRTLTRYVSSIRGAFSYPAEFHQC